ncbi:MAG: hypothetical protein B7Z80_12215 [Rhodospirillales bacterium 20-64-7]|nr:MAG: hypothetical protein B7Z80_12215 [Rhodospirillales bacterium 20-64-7]
MAKKPKKHTIDVEDGDAIPLEIEPALLAFIILKARAFDAKVAPVEPDPASNAADDDEREILEDYPSDLTETELRDAISELPDDASVDLLACFWLGRGDFTLEGWAEARAQATERLEDDLVDYLLGEPAVGDFLAEGFSQLGYELEDYAG